MPSFLTLPISSSVTLGKLLNLLLVFSLTKKKKAYLYHRVVTRDKLFVKVHRPGVLNTQLLTITVSKASVDLSSFFLFYF